MRRFRELSPPVSLGVALAARRYWWLASGSSARRCRSLHTLGWSSSWAAGVGGQQTEEGGSVSNFHLRFQQLNHFFPAQDALLPFGIQGLHASSKQAKCGFYVSLFLMDVSNTFGLVCAAAFTSLAWTAAFRVALTLLSLLPISDWR